jgi:VanZ family protein
VNDRTTRTRLPHALAALYALAVVYASLGPFGPWMAPPPATRFFLLAWPARLPPRYDVVLNLLAYLPFGLFLAQWPRRAAPARRIAVGFCAGALLSLAMESLQMLVPARDANPYDFVANAAGALTGALLGALLARSPTAKGALTHARTRLFVPGHLGDMGLALLALWLVAQTNPGIPLFAVAFHPAGQVIGTSVDGAEVLLDAAGSAFQLIGVGLFTVLLLRDGESARAAVLLLVGAALLLKIGAAALLLKPTAWQSWIRPGVLTGIAAGALLLPLALAVPRPAQVATCGVALLASLVTPLVAPELIGARASMGLFEWRTGQLLNYNGLSHVALLAWPLLAAAWLFALAGRPAWGRANEAA